MDGRVVTRQMLTDGQEIPILLPSSSKPPTNGMFIHPHIRQKLDQLSGEGKQKLQETEHLILSKIGASYGMSADEAKRLIGDNTTQLKKQLLDHVDQLMESVANDQMAQYFETARRFFTQLADFVANVSRKTVDFIVQGLVLTKQVVHDIFQQVQDALAEAWRQFIHWY